MKAGFDSDNGCVEIDARCALSSHIIPLFDFLALHIDKGARQAIMQKRFLAELSEEATYAVAVPRWEKEWRLGSACALRSTRTSGKEGLAFHHLIDRGTAMPCLVTMSQKELHRLAAVQKVKDRRLSVSNDAKLLSTGQV